MKKFAAVPVVLVLLLLSCGDNPAGVGGGDGFWEEAVVANAIVITLTSWQTAEKDGLLNNDTKLDPRIHFLVLSYENGRLSRTETTSYLLNRDDLGQSWSGNSKSSPIPFMETAGQLRVEAVVAEKDALFDDDISPGYYKLFTLPAYRGERGSVTLEKGSGKSQVTFNYEFVRQ